VSASFDTKRSGHWASSVTSAIGLLLICCSNAHRRFLHGVPPFHADTPERVFDNVLTTKVQFHPSACDISPEARDFIERLLCSDPALRLGYNGASEVRAHPFLAGVDWANLRTSPASFIPQITDPESTDYFDPRGATGLCFDDQEPMPVEVADAPSPGSDRSPDMTLPRLRHSKGASGSSETPAGEDFGAFEYRNLEVLRQANDDVIRKLRTDQLQPIEAALDRSTSASPPQVVMPLRPMAVTAHDEIRVSRTGPAGCAAKLWQALDSPSASISSTPSRTALPEHGVRPKHERRPSEALAPLGRILSRASAMSDASQHSRRNSLPSRLRTASFSSSSGPSSGNDTWNRQRRGSEAEQDTPASSVGSPSALPSARLPGSVNIDVLVAEGMRPSSWDGPTEELIRQRRQPDLVQGARAHASAAISTDHIHRPGSGSAALQTRMSRRGSQQRRRSHPLNDGLAQIRRHLPCVPATRQSFSSAHAVRSGHQHANLYASHLFTAVRSNLEISGRRGYSPHDQINAKR
jgi:serine/threonine protein kinase